MKIKLFDLLEYNQHANQLTIDLLVKNALVSPPKANELFSHIINAHHVWNSRIHGKRNFFGIWQKHSPEVFEEMNDENYLVSKKILETIELDRIITYKNTTGEQFENSLSDILFHIINHSTYHRGQIMIKMREAGIEVPYTDYIIYKRKNAKT